MALSRDFVYDASSGAVRRQVLDRDGGICQIRGERCRVVAGSKRRWSITSSRGVQVAPVFDPANPPGGVHLVQLDPSVAGGEAPAISGVVMAQWVLLNVDASDTPLGHRAPKSRALRA